MNNQAQGYRCAPLVSRGISLLKLRQLARQLGATADWYGGNGEETWRHPAIAKPLVFNRRKKTATQHAVNWINRLVRRLEAAPHN